MFNQLLQGSPWVFTFVITLITIVLSVGGLLFTRRFFGNFYIKPEDTPVANIVMRQISTLLAVLLAFATISIWQDYELQRKHTAEEASIMGNLYRDSRGFDAKQESIIQELLVNYTKAVVEDAWPKMREKQESKLSWTAFNKLYGHVIRLSPQTSSEEVIFTRMVEHLNELAKYRRLRHIRNANPLIPGVLWGTLYLSTILIVISGFFLRTQNIRMQGLLTGISGFIFGLIFSLLLLLNNPYCGSMQISPGPIENLLLDVYPMADITQVVIPADTTQLRQ